jgi:hypothetical protein
MFNIRLKNLFIVLFLLISLILTYGCSQLSGKPSEEKMKEIILTIWGNPTQYNFEEFKITNEFSKKTNNEEFYCIEVIIKGNIELFKGSKIVITGERRRFSFINRGKEWYGYNGWKGVN